MEKNTNINVFEEIDENYLLQPRQGLAKVRVDSEAR